VTGVQTCALPICSAALPLAPAAGSVAGSAALQGLAPTFLPFLPSGGTQGIGGMALPGMSAAWPPLLLPLPAPSVGGSGTVPLREAVGGSSEPVPSVAQDVLMQFLAQ